MHHEAFSLAAIALMGVVALAAFLPATLRIAFVPAVLLEILFGARIGPQCLNLVAPSVTHDMIAELGLAVLFLIAGFAINPQEVRGAPTRLAIKG